VVGEFLVKLERRHPITLSRNRAALGIGMVALVGAARQAVDLTILLDDAPAAVVNRS